MEGRIEARAFHRFSDEDWDALDREAAQMLGFLRSRDPSAYSRYARWWGSPEISGAEPHNLG